MRPRISERTEWKLNVFAEKQLEGIPIENTNVSNMCRFLVEHHKQFVDQRDGQTWTQRAAELDAEEEGMFRPGKKSRSNKVLGTPEKGASGKFPPDKYRRCVVDDETVEELENVLDQEQPAAVEMSKSFDNLLNMVLECYNRYGKIVGLGWKIRN